MIAGLLVSMVLVASAPDAGAVDLDDEGLLRNADAVSQQGGFASRLLAIRRELEFATGTFESCEPSRRVLRQVDVLLDQFPKEPSAWYLLGESLRTGVETCRKARSRHARSAQAAFAKAVSLDPDKIRYVVSWASSGEPSTKALAAVKRLHERHPTNPELNLFLARRPEVPPHEKIRLLTSTEGCAQGQGLLLGELLEKEGRLREAAGAFRRELADCRQLGEHWAGVGLYFTAQARLGVARALALSDGFEARRQLALLRMIEGQAMLLLAPDQDEVQMRLTRVDRPIPDPAAGPEQALRAIEDAAFRPSPERFTQLVRPTTLAALETCNPEHWDPEVKRVCQYTELLPETITEIRCDTKDDSATCEVLGIPSYGRRTVVMEKQDAAWRLATSTR